LIRSIAAFSTNCWYGFDTFVVLSIVPCQSVTDMYTVPYFRYRVKGLFVAVFVPFVFLVQNACLFDCLCFDVKVHHFLHVRIVHDRESARRSVIEYLIPFHRYALSCMYVAYSSAVRKCCAM